MKVLSTILLATLVTGCNSTSMNKIESTQVQYNDKAFEEQLELIKTKEIDFDFTRLRYSYTDTKKYKPYKSGLKKEFFTAMNEGRFEECIKIANTYLQTDYISLPAHYALLVCNKEVENNEISDFHQYVLNGLIESILNSGDGKDPSTAFITISAEELYAFLQLNGLKAQEQALVRKDGKIYDKMSVIGSKTEKEFSLYFDVTLQMTKGMRFLN